MTDLAPFPGLAFSVRNLRLSVTGSVAQLVRSGRDLAQKAGLGGGLSDRRLSAALDLPVLADDPSTAGAATVRAQVTAMSGAACRPELLALIRSWDIARAATPQGRRKARIAAEAMLALPPAGAAPEHPVEAAVAAMVAMTEPHHAQALLDRFDAAEWASPLLAEAHYRLAVAQADAEAIGAAHDDWADLDPTDDAVWAGHGLHLLAQGNLSAIAAAAARAEWQTERWLGKGGYALLLLPVMDSAPDLWHRIDPERLAAATLDLARHRHRDQGTVNCIAARMARLASVAPPERRGLLRTSYRQLLEESLNVLLPAAWGLPEPAARRRVAEAFLPELRAGARLRATPAGLTLCDRSAD